MNLTKLTDNEVMGFNPKQLPKSYEEKLTNWKQEPSLNDLKHDLNQAKNEQTQYLAKLAYWEKLYNAPKFGDKNHKGSRINPKLVRKQAEWAIPALSEPFLSTEDLFDVKPLTHEDVDRARQNALVLNKQFSVDLKKTRLVDAIVRELVKKGTCILRVGWEYKEGKKETDVEYFQYEEVLPMPVSPMSMMGMEEIQKPSEYDALSQDYARLDELKIQSPDSYTALPSTLKAGYEMSKKSGKLYKAVSVGFKKEMKNTVLCNKPSVEICHLKNVYIDPTCKGDIDKANFIIHAYETSFSQLKENPLYKNVDNILLSETDSDVSLASFKDKARKRVMVYEYWGYWDITGDGTTKAIVATWVGETLIRMEENPFHEGKLPFVIFNFIPDEDSVYGVPNAELMGDNQEILGAVTRGMIDLLGKSANAQTGYAKNMLDATNKSKFNQGKDYEYNQGFDPRVHMYTHKYPEIPQSAMTIIQMMNNEAESMSGVKAFSGTGISASNLGDVAAGVRGVLDAVSKREMSILRRISDGFITLGRFIMAMNAEFLSEEEVVRLTNSEFIAVRRDDLAGEFDLSLSISTAEGDDAKAKELAFMLQTMGSSMGQGVMQMLLAEIARLRKMPDLANAIEQYAPEPNPFDEEMQQLELEYKRAEIELMKAEAMERQAKSQVQEAKVGVENAKAESLQGDADNKALDFVERDSGLSHLRAREMQQDRMQGELDKENLKASNQILGDLSHSLGQDMLSNGISADMVNSGLM